MGKKKLLKKLRQAAAKLPPATRPVLIRKSGADILAFNPTAKDKEGNPIDIKRSYLVRASAPVNHYRAMKKAKNSFGIAGAAGYFKGVLDAKERREKK